MSVTSLEERLEVEVSVVDMEVDFHIVHPLLRFVHENDDAKSLRISYILIRTTYRQVGHRHAYLSFLDFQVSL